MKLTTQQETALRYLVHGPVNTRVLAKMIGVTTDINATRSRMRRLENRGLVRRVSLSEDYMSWELTSSGRDALDDNYT